jgi:hypothetical protein
MNPITIYATQYGKEKLLGTFDNLSDAIDAIWKSEAFDACGFVSMHDGNVSGEMSYKDARQYLNGKW